MKLNLVVLRSKDIHAAKLFYEQLGLIFVEEQHLTGPIHYSSVVDNVVFELYPTVGDAAPCNTRLGFSLNEISPALIIHSKYEFNNEQVYVIVDPDGRKIEVRSIL